MKHQFTNFIHHVRYYIVEKKYIHKLFYVLTFLTFVSIFILLFSANFVGREGVEEFAKIQKEGRELRVELDKIDLTIATYSSLTRVKDRAKELGFQERPKTEYVR